MALGFPIVPAIQNCMPQLVWPAEPWDIDFGHAGGDLLELEMPAAVWAELLVQDVAGTVTSLGQLQGSRCLLILPRCCGLVSASGAIQWLDADGQSGG